MAAVADPAVTSTSTEFGSESPKAAVEGPILFDERLNGTWTLDKSVSDSMEPFLLEVGVPWLVRKGILSFGATLKLQINDTRTAVDLSMTTAMRTNENRVEAGKDKPWVRGDGTKMTADIVVKEGGVGFSMDMPADEKIGKPSMSSELVDDDTIHDMLKLVPKDPKRKPIVIKRTFRRQK